MTESWLSTDIPDEVLKVEGFHIHRADRSTGQKGGGICAWIKWDFSVKVLASSSIYTDVELLFLRLTRNNFKCLLLILYFPHGQSIRTDLRHRLSDYLTSLIDNELNIHINYPVFIVGDFNRFESSFLQLNFCLQNVVLAPTRDKAILDLILIPEELSPLYHGPSFHSPFGSSDHAVIHLRPLNESPTSSVEYMKILDFRDSHLNQIATYLSTFDFELCFADMDLDCMCKKFYEILKYCLSLLPFDVVKKTSSDKPWITSCLKVLINKRFSAYRSRNWPLYVHYRDKVKVAIFKAKSDWGARMRRQGASIWNIRNKVVNNTSDHDWLPRCIPGSTVKDLLEILSSEYISSQQVDQKPRLRPATPIVVPFLFRKEEVAQLLSRFDPRKAPGSDGIPSIVWTKLSSFLAEPLHQIFNTCLQTAELPSDWKLADVIPIPKTPKPNLSATRPISLLPVPARIFERRMMEFYKSAFTSRCDSTQFAYKENSSTTCALISLTDRIANALAEPDIFACHILALDMEKGFDRLSHDLLLSKMAQDRFDPYLILFLANYLSNRSQRVRWKSIYSDSKIVVSGVPQGSSVGPYLFNYFVSDITVPKDTFLLKYADDIILCASLSRQGILSPLAHAYESVTKWLSENRMTIRTDKCQQMFVSLRASSDSFRHKLANIACVNEMTVLGVTIDNTMNWKTHFTTVTKKASSRIFVLRQLKPFFDSKQLFTIYCSCIRSIMEYCAPMFVGVNVSNSRLIEQIQDRCHRIICGSCNCNCSLFVPLEYRRLILGWKLFQKLTSCSDHPLHLISLPRLHNSRNFRLPLCTNSMLKNSFIVVMSKLENSKFSL